MLKDYSFCNYSNYSKTFQRKLCFQKMIIDPSVVSQVFIYDKINRQALMQA